MLVTLEQRKSENDVVEDRRSDEGEGEDAGGGVEVAEMDSRRRESKVNR